MLGLAFNSPIVIKDYRQFFQLAQMFKALIFIMYVDPEDREAYQATLKTMVELRK